MKKRMLRLAACLLTGTFVLTGVCLDSQAAKKTSKDYDTVAIAQVQEYVNIRETPNEDGTIVGRLYDNAGADILKETGDWYQIKSGDVTGYVKTDYFTTGKEAKSLAAEVGRKVATVRTTTLMVRKKPSRKSKILSMVGDSETLTVLKESRKWVKVQIDDDVVGYISKDYVECKTEFVEAESIETTNARSEAVNAAHDRAMDMKDAAINAMNQQDPNEAAYAASEATAAAADAKVLAAEQPLDYEVQEVAVNAVAAAQEASYASAVTTAPEETAPSTDQTYEDETPSTEQTYEEETPSTEQAYEEETPSTDQAYEEEAPSTEQVYEEETPSTEQTYEEETPSTEQTYEEETPSTEQTYEEETPSTEQTYEEETPSTEQNNEDESQADTSSTRQNIVNFALQFVGNPYVYGGTSLTNGADCSGFTQSVFANFGISIPRTAGAQSVSGRYVDVANIKPGDLLFYEGNADYGIGHVTMYIGNGQVVHASTSSTGIIISDIGYRVPNGARSYID